MRIVIGIATIVGLALVVDGLFVGNNRLIKKEVVGFERGFQFEWHKPWTFELLICG
jgi:hypothetical protein